MKRLIAATTMLAGLVASTQAGLILSDQFNYPDGPIVGNIGSAWGNNSGAAGTLLVSNNTLIVSTSRAEDGYSFLGGKPYMTNSGAVLYSRYTVKCIGLPTSGGTYFSHFGGTNTFSSASQPITGHRARVWAATTNFAAAIDGAGAGQFYLYILNSQGSTTNGGGANMWPTALDTNTSYTIVTRYNVGSGVSALWVNPTAETDASATDPIVIPLETPPPTNGPINIAAYDFRQATGEGTMVISDLRVGTRFADVAGNNTAPLISSIPNQAIPANATTGPIPFTVEDAESPATELVVSNSSSNPALVPASGISVASDSGGTNRTITVTPAAGQQGSATITVYVSDSVNVSFTTFQVTVGAPTISSIPNQIAFTNTPVAPVIFTVADAENDSLSFGVASSNPSLVPSDNSHIIVSGTGSSRTVTLLPTAGVLGTTTITISASDGHNTTQTTFALTMRPHIGIVYNEDFNYTSWILGTEQSLVTGSGGSGGPWKHVSGTIDGEMQVTNGLVFLVHTNNEDVGANFFGATVYDGFNGVVFYSSFPVNFSFLPSANGDYFFHYQTNATDSSTFHCKLYASAKHAAAGKFRLGIANTGSAGPLDEFPADLSTNVNYTVVMRYNSGTGESALWVNPYTESGMHALANDARGASFTGAVGLRQPGSSIGDLTVGPMKVSTEWSDVVGAATPLKIQQTDATHVQLTWSYPFTLQTSSSLSPASWSDVTGATSPYTYTITGDQQYFRLSY